VGERDRFLAQLDELSRQPEPTIVAEDDPGDRPDTHRVKRGETLSKIAAKYGTSVAALAKTNKIRTTSVIHAGQRLRIPGGGGSRSDDSERSVATRSTTSRPSSPEISSSAGAVSIYTVRRGDTVAKIASKYGVSVASILRANGLSTRSRIYPGQKLHVGGGAGASTSTKSGRSSTDVATYTVRSGDTLGKIAKRFGTSVSEILALNGLRANSVIRPGDRIRVAKRG
jgi:LysM repeat protein